MSLICYRVRIHTCSQRLVIFSEWCPLATQQAHFFSLFVSIGWHLPLFWFTLSFRYVTYHVNTMSIPWREAYALILPCTHYILLLVTIRFVPGLLFQCFLLQKYTIWPWLVWLSRLSASLQTKGLPVWIPVRAHAWVLGQVPSVEHMRGNHTLMFLSLSSSLPSPL